MPYCTNCGEEIEPGYAYCENCGAEIRTELRQATTDSIALASLGQRAGAIVIDTLIMWFFWGLLVFLMGLSAISGGSPGFGVFWVAVFTELAFVVGYTVLLEGYWDGRTIGKIVFEIQVVNAETGLPIGINEAVIRNVIRIADFLPFFYLIGITAMVKTDSNQRLGDLAANTLVVEA